MCFFLLSPAHPRNSPLLTHSFPTRRAPDLDTIDVCPSAEDADTAKPAPDILQVALERAAAARERAVMIGDAVWDVEAAGRAGVRCIGVLTGGTARSELETAGTVAVYQDVAEILAGLDESILIEKPPTSG